MKHWFAHYKERVQKLNLYATALEEREKKLIRALSLLAQRYGREVPKQDWSHAMSRLAGEELEEVAKMRVPPRVWP